MKILPFIVIILTGFPKMLLCQSDTLIINLKDGTTEKIAVGEIKKLEFENIVGVNDLFSKSQGLRLKGNYPNPFNETTAIEFEIDKPGNVEIFIYDNSGKRINTLTRQNCPKGQNRLDWDCRDKNGRVAPRGAYYYEVRFGGEVQSKKMLIVK